MFNSLTMLGNYFITGVRAVLRHKTHLALNLIGLTTGLASALLILLYIDYELGYDKMHPQSGNTYRLEQFFIPVNQRFPITSPAMQDMLHNYDNRIRLTRINMSASELRLPGSAQSLTLQHPFSVEENITDFFQIDILAGDLAATLAQPNQIALSEFEAERLFGHTDILGKQLQLGEQTMVVSAVFRWPEQSHFQASSLQRMDDEVRSRGLGMNSVYSYLYLPDDLDKTAMLQQLSQQLNQQAYSGQNITDLQLRALTDIHLYSSLTYEVKVNGSASTVVICLFLAALLILIAAINFINMSTARAGMRAKEVGVRKALGASRGQLFVQFMLESVLIATCAGLLAAVLVELLLPQFNLLVNRPLTLDYIGRFGLMLVGSSLAVGLLAGIYPAVFISAFDAKKVLSGDFQRGTTAIWLRKGLLILQGAITIGLLVSTVVLQQQLHLLQNQPTGYDRQARLMVNGIANQHLFWADNLSLPHALQQLPGVDAVSLVDIQLTDTISQVGSIQVPGQTELSMVSEIGAGFNIVRAAGLTLLAGRDFSESYQADWYQEHAKRATAAVIITESLAKRAGYTTVQDAIGQQWTRPSSETTLLLTVVGVVTDVQIGSALKQQEPLMFICGYSVMNYANLILNVAPTTAVTTRDQVQQLLSERLQRQDLDISWLGDDYTALYQNQQRQGQVIAIFAALAIALTCIGLFGLAAFSAEQRSREVAMRKVLGAGRFNLVNLLASEYLKLMALSAVLAIPATFLALENWLAEFSSRVSQSPLQYLLAAAITFAICWCTVAVLAWQVAGRKPAMVLRQQ